MKAQHRRARLRGFAEQCPLGAMAGPSGPPKHLATAHVADESVHDGDNRPIGRNTGLRVVIGMHVTGCAISRDRSRTD